MFTIEAIGPRADKRVVATSALTEADFRKIAKELMAVRARKVGLVAARVSEAVEHVKTCWNDEETTNQAEPGDWIVTSLTPQGSVLRDGKGHANTYVIRAASFPGLYEPLDGRNEFGRTFKPKGVVEAIRLPAGFDILAPWGERQTAAAGYLILNGAEVYGNNEETFKATYEIIS